jgi:hypothetical protein
MQKKLKILFQLFQGSPTIPGGKKLFEKFPKKIFQNISFLHAT